MTDSYLVQLQTSAINLRMQVPSMISQAVADKISLVQERSGAELPETVIYSPLADEKRFSSTVHLARVRLAGWQLQLVKATKKSNEEEVLVAVVIKVGALKSKSATSDHRNGNNPRRAKQIRR
jgi:hypothetical protein